MILLCLNHNHVTFNFSFFTGWFGIRKDFCDFLLGTCPFLQEYGNISCKFSESIFTRPPQEETSIEPQRKPVVHEYPAKCVVPVVSIEMPDWNKNQRDVACTIMPREQRHSTKSKRRKLEMVLPKLLQRNRLPILLHYS